MGDDKGFGDDFGTIRMTFRRRLLIRGEYDEEHRRFERSVISMLERPYIYGAEMYTSRIFQQLYGPVTCDPDLLQYRAKAAAHEMPERIFHVARVYRHE